MYVKKLPTELQLMIASSLKLRELILLRNSSRHWQALVNNNLSFICRARRSLLLLWDDTIRSPHFLPSRKCVLAGLRPFDRTQYLASISHGLPLPEEFEVWVLEWPAKAVIGWTWPGLNAGAYPKDIQDWDGMPLHAWWQPRGFNNLAAHGRFIPGPLPSVYTLPRTASEQKDLDVWFKRERSPMDGSEDRVYEDVVKHGAGVALTVWTAAPTSEIWRDNPYAHMLILTGLGAPYDGSVQAFKVQRRLNLNDLSVATLRHTHPRRGTWQDGVWMPLEGKGLHRATSWGQMTALQSGTG